MATRLTIREQASLSWRKQVEIAVDGIQYRLLRSTLTLGVVVLAVAFLTNILVENEIASACKRGVQARAADQRELSLLAGLVDSPLEPRELGTRLAALPPAGWPLGAFPAWLGLPEGDLARFQADCLAWREADAWLEDRAPGHRRLLAGKRGLEETFTWLEEDEARRTFLETARRIPLQPPAGFMAFAERRRAFLTELEALAARFAAARARLAAALGGRPLSDWLAASEPGQAAAVLAEHGLRINPDRLESLLRRARDRDLEWRLLNRLRTPELPAAWRENFSQVFEQDRALDRLSSDPATVEWVLARTGGAASLPPLEKDQAGRAAFRILEARRLTEVEDRLTANYGARSGLSANMFWLLVVSFMVCMAGITNAMLLSVIERFREIATMKCLGALNDFIARLFLLEAAFLGLVGGLLGVLLGGAIGIARMTAAYGDWVGLFFPWTGLGWVAGIATACGLVLATLSALYPAWSAARMPPIEAMRVE